MPKIEWEPNDGRPMRVGYTPTDTDGKFHVVYQEDEKKTLKFNRRKLNAHDPFIRKAEDFHHVAVIPQILAMHWLQKHGVNVLKPEHGPAVERLLHDPDYSYARVAPGSFLKQPSRSTFVPCAHVGAGATPNLMKSRLPKLVTGVR